MQFKEGTDEKSDAFSTFTPLKSKSIDIQMFV
jgi:hypothetical protein